MTFTFFTNCISPHQLPLAKQLMDKLGAENYRYIYMDALTEERQRMGWGDAVDARWCQQGDATHKALADADVVMSGVRSLDLFDARLKKDKTTLYCSERWFKPPLGFIRVFEPSYFKMVWRFVQCLKCKAFTYLPMGIHAARDMARLVGFLTGDVRCLFGAPKVAFESRPGGAIVPLKEAIRVRVLSKDEIAFGKIHGFVQIPRDHWGKVKPQKVYAKMRLWGYFVASGKGSTEYTDYTEEKPQNTQKTQKGCCAQDCQCGRNHEIHEMHEKGPAGRTASVKESTEDTDVPAVQLAVSSNQLAVGDNVRLTAPDSTSHAPLATSHRTLRVLWVGRMLKLKRVDTLMKACVSDVLKEKVELHLYGHGPEEEKLKQLATKGDNVFFHDFVPVAQVRDLMRTHDVYVFSSNAGDGWGAVVSEALEEGMKVLGTTGAGSSATILPPTHLFKAGDVKRLIELLSKEIEHISIGEWTAEKGAQALLRE